MAEFRLAVYVDEDSMQREFVDGLRAAGLRVTTAREAGNIGLSDALQLRFAAAKGWPIITANHVDYLALDAEWRGLEQPHAGIICVRQGRLDWYLGEVIHRMIDYWTTQGVGSWVDWAR